MSTSLKDLVPRVAADPPQEGRLVEAPEFDLTQVAKKLALAIPVFATAIVGGLKALGVEKATDPAYVIAALGVTAAGLLALGIVAAADIVGRAYVEASKRLADATSTPGVAEPSEVDGQEKERLDAAAQGERGAQDRDAEAERTRLDRLAEEERQRLDRVADDERERQGRVAEQERTRLGEERQRLDRVADDERERQDRDAEAERKRLDRLAEEERQRLERVAKTTREE